MTPTLPADGKYRIVVQGRGTETGTFRVLLKNVKLDEATRVSYGNEVTTEITPSGDVDIFTFEGKAGDVALIAVTHDWSCYALVELLDSQGNSVAKSGQQCNLSRMTPTLPADGKYQVVVQGRGTETGNYTFFLKALSGG